MTERNAKCNFFLNDTGSFADMAENVKERLNLNFNIIHQTKSLTKLTSTKLKALELVFEELSCQNKMLQVKVWILEKEIAYLKTKEEVTNQEIIYPDLKENQTNATDKNVIPQTKFDCLLCHKIFKDRKSC